MIPQMILIHFLDHVFFADSLHNKIPHRILVINEIMTMTPMIIITIPRPVREVSDCREASNCGLREIILTIIIDQIMDNS